MNPPPPDRSQGSSISRRHVVVLYLLQLWWLLLFGPIAFLLFQGTRPRDPLATFLFAFCATIAATAIAAAFLFCRLCVPAVFRLSGATACRLAALTTAIHSCAGLGIVIILASDVGDRWRWAIVEIGVFLLSIAALTGFLTTWPALLLARRKDAVS